jgi:hypothetical protein
MPHDLVTERQDVILKDARGAHDMVALAKYEAPANAEGGIAYDPFKTMDMANAKWMADVLLKAYPGYPWRCVYDGHQKMAYLSIPILMGINKFWAINLTTDQMTDGLLKRAGGELLERYEIPRGRFELTPFLEAREKHSALVVPGRKVPG